ncbi:ATP-dependent DNA helicase MPH1, partial [Frankliniella fusca]
RGSVHCCVRQRQANIAKAIEVENKENQPTGSTREKQRRRQAEKSLHAESSVEMEMIPVSAVRVEGDEEDEWLHPWSRLVRATSRQIAAMRTELRMPLPVFNKNDLRRYRMYESGSVLLELLSSGDDWAAQMLWQLLQLDGAARCELDAVEGRALRRPPLASCPELLHALAVGLSAASAASGAGASDLTPLA